MHIISTFSIPKLNNAEFVAYFVNLNKMIEGVGSENLGIDSSILSEYASTLTRLIDQVYTTPGSQYTAQMKEFDSQRDQIFKRIRLRLQMVTVAENNSDLLACKDIVETTLLAKYGAGVVTMPQHEESAVLNGFIYDIKNKLDEDAIDALGIMSDITALEMANNGFINAYNKRSDERAAGDTGLTLKLRNKMNDLNTQINFTLQYLANSTLEANATKAAACQTFIASLNVVLADVKKRYNQRTNGGTLEDTEDTPTDQPTDDTPSSSHPGEGNNQQPSDNNQSGSNNNQPSGGGQQQGSNDGPIDNGSSVIF